MSADGGGVRKDGLIADLHVVRDVNLRHNPIVVADARDASAANGTAMDADEFTNCVAVADDGFALLAMIFFVLRGYADGGVRIEDVVLADGGDAFDKYVSDEPGARSNGDVRSNDAVGADFDVIGQARG